MPDLSKPTLAWNLVWDADWVTSVAFLGSHRRVAAGNNLGQILLWELPDKPGADKPAPGPVARLEDHTNVVSRLAAAPPTGRRSSRPARKAAPTSTAGRASRRPGRN